MKVEWEFPLPVSENSEDYEYESPIFVKDDRLYFISCTSGTILHIIDIESGTDTEQIKLDGYTSVPSYYFFEQYRDKIIIYTGTLWILQNHVLHRIEEFTFENRINFHIIRENSLFFADSSRLYCFNLDLLEYSWDVDISNTSYYRSGELSLFENTVVCYGNDKLLFVNPDNGNVIDEIKISRAAKLFSPIRIDENNMLIGFTNWSNAGIIKYDTKNKKVIWKNKRSFEGPLLRCKIYKHEKYAYWVKNDTELICVNIDSGEEVYSIKTAPWLYTDLHFYNNRILFGTAGRDGYFMNIDAFRGDDGRSVFLKNGCEFYDIYDDSVILGDFDKNIYRIDIETGNKIQTLSVGGEVVGDVKVYKNHVYTVIWGDKNHSVRLIKIKM